MVKKVTQLMCRSSRDGTDEPLRVWRSGAMCGGNRTVLLTAHHHQGSRLSALLLMVSNIFIKFTIIQFRYNLKISLLLTITLSLSIY